MKKLKQRILFCSAAETDFFKANLEFSYYPYSFFYWRLKQFKPSSLRDGVLQLVEANYLDKIIRNSTPLFRLTSRGRDQLLTFFPLSFGQKRVWDWIWRLALISSRQGKDNHLSQLRSLRKSLRELGFKKFSRGVYLTPLPVSKEVKQLAVDDLFKADIAVIESKKLLIGDSKQIAKKFWPVDQLVKDYLDLISKIKKMLKGLKKKKDLSNKEKNNFSLILNRLFTLLEKDPGLPKKVLPGDWPADQAKELFLKLALKISKLEKRQKLQ